jgi:two-component system NarL family sensor kinase
VPECDFCTVLKGRSASKFHNAVLESQIVGVRRGKPRTGRNSGSRSRRRLSQTRALRVLKEVAEALNRATTEQRATSEALSRMADFLGVETGWVWLRDPESDRFYNAAVQNLPPYLQEPVRMTGRSCWCLELFRKGRLTRPELDLLTTVADQVSVAIERARLGEQSIEHARADERSRIARDVHDTLAQGFTAVGLHIEAGLSHLEPRNQARPALALALDAARQGLDEARRSITSLRASPLENRSLAEALGALSRRFTADTGVRVRVDIADVGAVPADIESELFRIAGEALTNVRKHAGAREATLRLDVARRRLRLTVADAGVGFRARGARRRGFGLSGIEDRARAVGGRATIRSAPGQGTTVIVTVPIDHD